MTGEADRRIARRFMMMLPMRVLPGGAQHHELRTLTRNVSYQGSVSYTHLTLPTILRV